MANEKTETEQFLSDLNPEQQTDVLTEPLNVETPTEKEEELEEEGFQAKNRRERRLLEQNQRLREEAIATNARLQGIKDAQELGKSTEEADFLKTAEGIYGNDTPEKALATEIYKRTLSSLYSTAKEDAKKEVFQELDERQSSDLAEEKEASETLDEMLENIEDDYKVDFGTDSASMKGFLSLLERISPKDEEGNIVEYADPYATWEMYRDRKAKSNIRAKELADRSMTRSGNSAGSKLVEDATERFLKENGLLW